MPKSAKNEGRGRLLLCLGFTALFAMLAILPYWFRSEAGPRTSKQVSASKTSSRDPELPNYDIRTDKAAGNKIIEFRGRVHKDASAIADIRDNFVRGEESLKQRVPTLKVEYNNDLRIPEVIGPDIKQEKAVLASANGQRHSDVLRSFLQQYSDLIGVSSTGEDNLKTFADYTNPDGNLSFVELDQEINGIPVFQGQVKAGFTKKGEMFRVINNLAAGLDNVALQSDFGDSANAVRAAATAINNQTGGSNLRRNPATSNNLKDVYGDDDWATTAEKTYFPTEPGVAVAAWKVLIWQPNNAYYLVIDAETGTLLWRKNLTSDQTQSATYNVYANPNAMINVARNPFPLTPGPTAPGTGVQGSAIARTLITRIGNEPPYDFNNLGWITDGNNTTDGNNVQAGLDRSSPDGIDTAGNGVAVGTNRVFDFPVNPFDPNTNTGDSPIPAGEPTPASSPGTCSTTPANHTMIDYQRASVTQLFYVANWYHDITYTLGFTEAARNYQNDNFGRGGAAADRISAEGQDCSSRNNANFSAPPDGNRGRMQMYLFTGPNPDIDSDFDADVMVHELTHGLSNRLHGNSTGLSNTMAGGMGEGWSDFYALSLLSQPTDPVNGVYAAGPYDTYKLVTNYTDNNYYGIRRFPYAIKSATGGPGNLPFNPITFADIDDSQLNLNDGAFVKSPVGFAPSADEVHNAGEIWCSALWEVRGRFVTRLGWAVGNRKALQLVTDGMKLAPLSPTFISERDAIVAATKAGGTQADLDDVWAGFAARGVGFSASVQQIGTGGPVGNPSVTVPTRVTEAFDLPNLVQTPALTVSDSAGNNNSFPEPGENLTITVPLTNTTGKTANNVTLQLVGGGSANYGTITDGITTSQQVSFTVPANTSCGSAVILTLNINSDLGPTSYTRVITIGVPSATFSENFDSVTAPAFPAGWTAVSVSSGINFVTTTVNSDSGPNSAFAADPTSVGGGSDLTSPSIPITASAATLTFRQRYDTEADWDGGVLEISIAGGAFQDILTAGGSFVQNGYNGNLGAGSVNSPLQTRNAWTGNSSGYITTIVRLPAAAAG
ncbi:MAG TPA: M36 family metallopeptidase, partial [Pyrinomonadaceae bacterium]|nr:M36 family metallopeptidase [Pyrinomonadaceae bacterium]